MSDNNRLEEKLYRVTYEHRLEPYSSRTTKFSVGTSPKDAETKLLSRDPQKEDLIVMGIQEFKILGYRIRLEKIVK